MSWLNVVYFLLDLLINHQNSHFKNLAHEINCSHPPQNTKNWNVNFCGLFNDWRYFLSLSLTHLAIGFVGMWNITSRSIATFCWYGFDFSRKQLKDSLLLPRCITKHILSKWAYRGGDELVFFSIRNEIHRTDTYCVQITPGIDYIGAMWLKKDFSRKGRLEHCNSMGPRLVNLYLVQVVSNRIIHW